jgi:hypothetical protein
VAAAELFCARPATDFMEVKPNSVFKVRKSKLRICLRHKREMSRGVKRPHPDDPPEFARQPTFPGSFGDSGDDCSQWPLGYHNANGLQHSTGRDNDGETYQSITSRFDGPSFNPLFTAPPTLWPVDTRNTGDSVDHILGPISNAVVVQHPDLVLQPTGELTSQFYSDSDDIEPLTTSSQFGLGDGGTRNAFAGQRDVFLDSISHSAMSPASEALIPDATQTSFVCFGTVRPTFSLAHMIANNRF